MVQIFGLFALSLSTLAHSQAYDPDFVSREFESAGLKCAEFDKKLGLQCQGRLTASDYEGELAVFIPAHYTVKKHTDEIFHLHGWLRTAKEFESFGRSSADDMKRLEVDAPEGPETEELIKKKVLYRGKNKKLYRYEEDFQHEVLGTYRFAHMLARTHRDAILIVPGGRGKETLFKKEFGVKKKFEPYLRAVNELLVTAKLSQDKKAVSVELSGHSGAYHPMASILLTACAKHDVCYAKKISHVDLFDAVYGEAKTFADWAALPQHHLVSVFAGTHDGNKELFEALPEDVRTRLGGDFDSAVIESDSVKDSELKKTDPCFIKSDKHTGHAATFPRYFPVLLRR